MTIAGRNPTQEFHAHLDVCERCRKKPMDLCYFGAALLKAAALRAAVPAYVMTDEERVSALRSHGNDAHLMSDRRIVMKLKNGRWGRVVGGDFVHPSLMVLPEGFEPESVKRYRVGDAVENFGPPFAVLDDAEQTAIALCWSREKAQTIVDALNRKGSC